MGAVVAIGATIASATAAVTATAVSVITAVVSATVAAVSAVAATVAGGIAATVSTIVSGVGAALASTASFISSTATAIYNVTSPTVSAIWGYAKAVVGGIKSFLEFIHFKTIMKVHSLALVFSKDYREIVQKMYREISEVSEELGFWPQMLTLMFQDARQLVLDASSAMGQSYDLGQVQWLKSMNQYLKGFADKAETFENNPEALLLDIQENLQKPAIDAKAGFVRQIAQFVESGIEIGEKSAEHINILRKDLEKLAEDIPGQIGDKIREEVLPVTEKVDDFLNNEYLPLKRDLSNGLRILKGRTQNLQDRTFNVENLMSKPGDLVSQVDKLPDDLRLAQEDQLYSVVSRPVDREIRPVSQSVNNLEKELKRIHEAISEPRRPPKILTKEPPPRKPAPQTQIKDKSWYRGDY